MTRSTKSVVLVLFAVCGCSAGLPLPETTRHSREVFAPIPYPPPAALAETVPQKPQGEAVWIDGEWVFHGRSFVWQRGGWVVPPPGARFARWRTVYQRDGRLLLAPGTWYDASGHPVPRPEIAVSAATPPNETTSELQTGR